jgi:hypothetical protein
MQKVSKLLQKSSSNFQFGGISRCTAFPLPIVVAQVYWLRVEWV